ncbi:hypothetical protein ACU4GD_31265 [Cupriavidus basilensis]
MAAELLNFKGFKGLKRLKGLKSKAVSPPLRGGDLLFCLAKKVGKKGAPDGATTPRRQAKRAAGTQTRIALRRYSNMGPSFPLFLPADEDAPYGLVHLDGSLRIALGCGPPLGRSTRLRRIAGSGDIAFFRSSSLTRSFDLSDFDRAAAVMPP